jgi:hypothetical protein
VTTRSRNLNITLTETDIIKLAKVLVVKEKWEKEDFIKFGEKQSDFWNTLAEYDDEVSEVAKEKFLKYTDADILKISFSLQDVAFYQSVCELKNEIQQELKDQYHDETNFDAFWDDIVSYYMRQYSSVLDLCKGFCESIKGALQSVDILVTNEYFWGKVPYSKDIIKEMEVWSSHLPHTILCTNFLLKDDTEIPAEKIKEEAASLRKVFIPVSYNKNNYPDRLKDPVRNKLLYLMESSFFNSEEPSFIAYLEHLNKLSSVKGSFRSCRHERVVI